MADDFDPSAAFSTMGDGDPLAEWAKQIQDPALGMLMVTDPQKAVEVMKARGIEPPPTSASAYTNPVDGSEVPGTPSDADLARPIRTNPNGTLAGNITSPIEPQGGGPTDNRPIIQRIHDYFTPSPVLASPGPKPPAASVSPPNPSANAIAATPPQKANSQGGYVEGGSAGTDLDPAEDKPTAPETKPATPDKAKAFSGFADSLKGVRAPPLPPLNAVGTPSVRSPGALSPASIAQLLALTGQAAPGSALGTLGRLLVQGKA